eukprot:3042634-Rhodomonas_salina.3
MGARADRGVRGRRGSHREMARLGLGNFCVLELLSHTHVSAGGPGSQIIAEHTLQHRGPETRDAGSVFRGPWSLFRVPCSGRSGWRTEETLRTVEMRRSVTSARTSSSPGCSFTVTGESGKPVTYTCAPPIKDAQSRDARTLCATNVVALSGLRFAVLLVFDFACALMIRCPAGSGHT